MRRILAAISVGWLLSAAPPLGADEEVDMGLSSQRDVGQLLSDYQRGLRTRVGALKRDASALASLPRDSITRVSSFQREYALEQARRGAAEARTFLEKDGALSDFASRSLARVDDILKAARRLGARREDESPPPRGPRAVPDEPPPARVGPRRPRRTCSAASRCSSPGSTRRPGASSRRVFRAFLDLSRIAIENEADAGR